MNFEESYLLDVIDQLTWEEQAAKVDEAGNKVKITLEELLVGTGFNDIQITILLNNLKKRKVISDSRSFSGANVGWFATRYGHQVAFYRRGGKN